jgi:hypothetical protein
MLAIALLSIPAWLLLPLAHSLRVAALLLLAVLVLARILRAALLGLLLPTTTLLPLAALLALLLPRARLRGVALSFPATAIAALFAAAHGDTIGLDDRSLSLWSGLRPSHPRLLGPFLPLEPFLSLRTRLRFNTAPFLRALGPLRLNALLLLLFDARLTHLLRLLLARFTARRLAALLALLLALCAARGPAVLVLRHCRDRHRHQHRGQNHLTHLSPSNFRLPFDRLLGVGG